MGVGAPLTVPVGVLLGVGRPVLVSVKVLVVDLAGVRLRLEVTLGVGLRSDDCRLRSCSAIVIHSASTNMGSAAAAAEEMPPRNSSPRTTAGIILRELPKQFTRDPDDDSIKGKTERPLSFFE